MGLLKEVSRTLSTHIATALGMPSQRTGYILTGMKDLFRPLMSEYVFAYTLALERNIFQTYENQQERLWQDMSYKRLKGTLHGICGLDSISSSYCSNRKEFWDERLGL